MYAVFLGLDVLYTDDLNEALCRARTYAYTTRGVGVVHSDTGKVAEFAFRGKQTCGR